jgi:4-methylaminobutanoate oxidase (formaldehyde-forming)
MARDILQPLTAQSLDNADFKFGQAKEVEIGHAFARAHRVSYVGELGWELYVSTEMAEHVFDVVMEAGAEKGLMPAGMHVLDSCRIEKAFRHFGHDISDEDHILEAGLGFAVKTDKQPSQFGEFIGRDAVLRKREAGMSRRLMQFQLKDPQPLLYHNEPILKDGEITGYLTSGNYGHYLGAAIGLGYVKCAADESVSDLLSATYEIDVAGQLCAAQASLKPLYDPTGERMKG